MKKYGIMVATALGLLFVAASAGAQAPGGTMMQGFNVQALISEVSLFLPEESTRGMYGGRGGAAGQGAQGGQGAQSGMIRFPQLQFTRDQKLFLTKDQIAKLLPIFLALKDNPMPTPSKAKEAQASVDAILTVAQKAEYADFQKQMQKAIEDFRKQMSASGAMTGAGQSGGGGTDAQRQAGQGRSGGTGGAQMTALQRRQRQIDAFVKVLQDRQKQLGA
jgi:hypothetical protein